jgi:glycosyltransferase involved in cell wall biosynthesis
LLFCHFKKVLIIKFLKLDYNIKTIIMNIAINARVLNERRGGPARFTYNILRELARIDTQNRYFLLLYDKVDFDFKLPDNFIIKIFKIKSKIIFDYIILPLFSYLHKIDFYLFPKNTFSPLIYGKKIPFFNDIVYFEKLGFREFKFFDNFHHTLMIPVAGKLSIMNVAISNYTALRMESLLNIKKDKIRVIHLGIENKFKRLKDEKALKKYVKKFNIQMPFFFYSGSLSPRKNIINIIKAFSTIKDHIPHYIYITGGDSWRDKAVFDLINESNLAHRIIKVGFLADDELITMYNLADCYLYPSKYEGFGLPILEAQACGCPVITSNTSSCPEIAGDGALFVDPYNVDDIAAAMMKITIDKKLRSNIIKKGFINCKKYSWQFTAKQLLNLFKEINSDRLQP